MTDLTQLSLRHAQEALKNRSLSARELTTAYLGAIAARNPALNAYITVTPERALADADASDARLARGEAGALEGIPLAVKDLFCTKGIRTTAASKMLAEFMPPYESTVTARLNAAGAVMLGKTNLDEFAMGSSNATSYFGPVVSPWKEEGSDKALVPGGSSGGSAAAVAAGLCMAATGTDTGGSIRQPAAFCGIVGVKPTYGRASRYGIIAFASSLDQAGMFARNVYDAALTQTVISGHDAKDSTSAPREVPDFTALLGHDLNGMTIGIPKEYRVDGTDPEILALWQQGARWLEDAGAKLVEVSLPHTQHALAVYYVLAPAEASSNLARFDGVRYGLRVTPPSGALADMYEHTRAQGFGREVKRRILIGTYVLSAGYFDAYYRKAQSVRRLIAQDFTHAFTQVDALLTPTAPTPAFALDAKPGDPLLMYLNDVFTIPTSLAGLPAISVPAGLSARGLPLGLQLIGKPFEEGTLFQVAAALETAANFSKRPAQGASV